MENKQNKANKDKGFATLSMLQDNSDDDITEDLNSHFGLSKKSKYMFVPYSGSSIDRGILGVGTDAINADSIFTKDIMLYDPSTNEPYKENGEIVRFKTGEDANNSDLQKINKILKDNVKRQAPTNKEFAS